MTGFPAESTATSLTGHFRQGTKVAPATPGPESRADAYRVQDLTIAALGGACGWKVGRAKTDPEPYCAPIPSSRRLESGSAYARPGGVALVEAELAFRLGRDVPASATLDSSEDYAALIDAVVPALEILETRLEAPAAQDALWKLADLQMNGGVVLGEPIPYTGQDLGEVRLSVGGQEAAPVAHPFGAPFELFCWTVGHVVRERGGLRRGDVIITGSYCGIVEVGAPQRFVAAFEGFGAVSLDVR